MREIWLGLEGSLNRSEKTKLLEEARRLCQAVIVSQSDLELAKSFGMKIGTAPGLGDIDVLEDADPRAVQKLRREGRNLAVKVTVLSRAEEEEAIAISEAGAQTLLIECPDWRVIPLENLISRVKGKIKILALVKSPEEAKLAVQTLELGADGVIATTGSVEHLKAISDVVSAVPAKVRLVAATVTRLMSLGTGTRVCVDTCDLMEEGEGILVGSQASGLFLVEAEVHENPHVSTRPFRVNAGPVSSYVLTSWDRVRYLSELKAGDEILIVKRDGSARTSHVGRVKIERRPLMLVEAVRDKAEYKTIVQNAETIYFVTTHGSKSVSELKPNDEILLRLEEGGRHFGVLVKDEMIIER